MEGAKLFEGETRSICHVIAVPYPGRGHVNPMMNLCKSLAARKDDILITFVVTEEWFGFIKDDPKPNQIQFGTIPNVIPSELIRSADFPGFYEAVMTKMEAPFEQLLDQIQPPPTAIVADTELLWVVPAGNRRNIPVASLWTMSASVLSMLCSFDLIQNRNLREHGKDYVDCVPGISPIRVQELPSIFQGNDQRVLELALECISRLEKAQFMLLNTVYEIEALVINTFKAKYPFPVYSIGPAIPYSEIKVKVLTSQTEVNHLQWLDSQPSHSVLYISLGSFLSVSNTQMEEIIAGVLNSGVRFFWVARGDNFRLGEICGDKGLVVSWCDQLRVLCHPSIGGFWTHCGWNSTLEALFAGVPMLTFPIFFDQPPNGKQIVEDWKVGWRVREVKDVQRVVTREEISELVLKFTDPENCEGEDIRRKASELKLSCQTAIAKGGSTEANLDLFIKDITQCHGR